MYPNTLRGIKEKLLANFPNLVPDDNGNQAPKSLGHIYLEDGNRNTTTDRTVAAYLLWMCNTIEVQTDRGKQSRWLGWVLAVAERELGLLTNDESRALVRSDK